MVDEEGHELLFLFSRFWTRQESTYGTCAAFIVNEAI